MDLSSDPDPVLVFSGFKMQTKILRTLGTSTYTAVFKKKLLRSHRNVEIKVFFLDFLLVVGRIWICTNNYGSGRPKTYGSGTLLITMVQVGTI